MSEPAASFFDPHAHGFVRVAAGVPPVHLADPSANAAELEDLWRRARGGGASLLVTPELSISGYSLEDLFQQRALLAAVEAALARLAAATRGQGGVLLVGAPLARQGRLFNCAVALSEGEVLGVVPKSYLPNQREFYEKRRFAAARDALEPEVELLGRRVPFGADLIFRCEDLADFALGVEICEDLWVPTPPSTRAALAGATVLANLSASNVTIGKAEWRRTLVQAQSGKCIAAYLLASAGQGESTTDLAWDGQCLIHENGRALAEGPRFSPRAELVLADVDLFRLAADRLRQTSFGDQASDGGPALRGLRRVPFRSLPRPPAVRLARRPEARPYVPEDPAELGERCREVYDIQVAGLAQRLRASGIRKVVLGVSGGLDSTQALLVSALAMDRIGEPRERVLAYTMPAYATSARTLRSAERLMATLGVRGRVLDVRPSCDQMLRDIEHPFAGGEPVYDRTFENVQAGERTSHLFRLANRHDALVVGTGDLSELALGWCTYGVGDQMSHYGVNASVPKTLIRHLIAWAARTQALGAAVSPVLEEVLATQISPELVPGPEGGGGGPSQLTEELIGPFELHDFSLYHATRWGAGPARIAFLAARAFEGRYELPQILRWLRVFLERFYRTSQFKRSALPDGPKVGSGGSLSPRGDWRAPSDASAAPWLAELDAAEAWIARSSP